MASAKINSALVLMLLSSMTAVSLWKAVPDKNKQESTTGGKLDVTDASEVEEDVSKPTPTDIPRISNLYDVDISYRLPGEVTPMSYRIRMIPILDHNETPFMGDVSIVVRAKLAADMITMHSKTLIITDYKVVSNDGSSDVNLIRSIKFDTVQEFFTMKLKERLTIGKMYTISMKFRGILTEYTWYNRHGFNKISYKDIDGSTQWMAAGYFMPTYARRAFPCFDEPNLKANFTVSIARKTDMTSLSNMDSVGPPERDPNLPETYVWDHYRETPKMSTYLVAFVVSNFKSKKAVGREFRVWVQEKFIDDVDRVLSDGIRILDAMENFTQTKLDLPKMEAIAIPVLNYPGIGNLGLLECREMDMLYRKGVTPANEMQDVTLFTALDMSNQWFGGLVTPDWWAYKWLNEGFALYLAYTATAMIEPNWRVMEQFAVFNQQSTFFDDSRGTSHAMMPQLENHYIVQTLVYGITYSKGSSLIRMMEHFLTRNTFREALRVYLSTSRHDTSTDDEFFEIMDAKAKVDGVLPKNLNVGDIMKSWTRKVGFPILTVERNYEDGRTTLAQEKFVLNRTIESNEGTWWIPITFTTQESPDFENTSPSQWMSTNHTSLTLDKNIPSDAWAIFNLQETGFYRVNYDERNWRLITEFLKTEYYYKVHPINRAQLIDDSFNLARYGYLDYTLALDLSTYLIRETDYIPWYSAFESFDYINTHLAASEEYPKFKSHVLQLIHAYYEAVNIDESPEDDHLKRLSRSKVTVWACRYNHDGCRTTAIKLFKQWMETKKNTIPVDSRKAVYCTAISEGGEREWNFLWNEFLSSTLWNEQVMLSEALGCSRIKETLNRYIFQSISKDVNLTTETREIIFTSATSTPDGIDVALDFPLHKLIREQSDYLFDIDKLAERISNKVQYEKMITEMRKAFGITSGDVEIAEFKTLETNNAWREKYVPIIESWLKINVHTNKV